MQKRTEIKKSTLTQVALLMIFIGIFIFSYYFRPVFLPNSVSDINIVAILGMLILVIINGIKLDRNNIIILFLMLLLSILYLNTQFINNKELIKTIKVLCVLILPMGLFTVSLNKKDFESGFKRFINLFNIFIILLLVLGIIDAVTNNMIAKIFANIFNNEFFSHMANEEGRNRYLSFMGHPLYNAQLFITYYILNNISNKYIKSNTKPIFVTTIAIVGVALTGGKTGMVLILIAIIAFSFSNIKIFIMQVILIIMALSTGIFSNTIKRFLSESLTTGRSESWQTVTRYNIMPIKFFTGYGYGATFDYNYYISWASAAFEYPIKMFSLEYGILCSIIFHIIILIIPIIIFLKRKQLLICIGYLIIFLDISMYNGLALAQDQMILFCFITFLILNLSKYIYDYNA